MFLRKHGGVTLQQIVPKPRFNNITLFVVSSGIKFFTTTDPSNIRRRGLRIRIWEGDKIFPTLSKAVFEMEVSAPDSDPQIDLCIVFLLDTKEVQAVYACLARNVITYNNKVYAMRDRGELERLVSYIVKHANAYQTRNPWPAAPKGL